MKNTTLCYIEKEDKYLMLLRNRKKIDENKDKWIGVGGKFEEGESPEECLIREVKEETGLLLTKYRFRGLVTFVSDEWGTEYMFLYTASEYEGELKAAGADTFECSEGTLKWIDKTAVTDLNLWEGDRLFLKLLMEDCNKPFFMKLCYKGDELIDCKVDI